jgi:hypothetical protein
MAKNGLVSSEKTLVGTSTGTTKTEKLAQSGVMALNSKLTFRTVLILANLMNIYYKLD